MCFSTHLLEEKKITKLTSRYYNFLNKATFEEFFNLFRLKFFSTYLYSSVYGSACDGEAILLSIYFLNEFRLEEILNFR